MRRRRRKNRIVLLLTAAVLITAAACFLTAFYVPEEQAEVQGNVRFSESEIRRMAMPGFIDHNSLYLRFLRGTMTFPDVPSIRSIEVEYLGRSSVRLHVSENYPVGYLLQDGYRYYFNADGIVTESGSDTNEAGMYAAAEQASVSEEGADTMFRPAMTDASLVSGLTEERVEPGMQIPCEDDGIFRTLLTIGKLASKLDIRPDEIRIGEGQTLTLRYGDVLAALGTDRRLDEKMSRLSAILPQLEGMKGTLHLESFSDETINIIFTRDDD